MSLSVKSEILSHPTQARTAVIDQESIAFGGHEVRISMDIARLVQPRQYLVQKSGDLVVRATSLEFSDPDRATSSNFACFVDVGFEVRRVEGGVIPGKDSSIRLNWSVKCTKIKFPSIMKRWVEWGRTNGC